MTPSDPSAASLSLPLPALAPGRHARAETRPAGLTVGDGHLDATVLHLFDTYRRPVTRYVASLGLAPADAEDVVQEVFLALCGHLQRQGADTNLPGWLFTVARNLGLKYRRRRQRWWQWLHPFEAQHHDCADPASGPEALLAEAERHERWQRVLAALPDRDRQCVVLRAEGLTYREIAAALELSLTSVARSMARALARFERVEER